MMKDNGINSILFVILLLTCLFATNLTFNSCKNYRTYSGENAYQDSRSHTNYPYEKMYKDSFDILISKSKAPNHPDKIDTLYTEMYIALKTSQDSKESQDIVLDRVEKLMQLDTIVENQIQYLEAKLIILSLQGKEDEFWDTAYKSYFLYPANSLERLSSLTAYYKLVRENPDSATYYFNKTLEIAETQLTSSDIDTRMMATVTKIMVLCIYDRDGENKNFIKKQLLIETDSDIIELLQEANNDYASIKEQFKFNPKEISRF